MPKTDIDIIENEESQMRGEGWFKELVIKKIIIVNGIPHCQDWYFFADTMPCEVRDGGTGPKCGADHTWIKCYHGKLFWACGIHKTAYGPISFEGTGDMAKQYQVNAEEAVKICKDFGQPIPDELKDLFRASRSISRKRRVPHQAQ